MPVFVVAGLGFGDEGKGTTVDFLTRQHKAHTVVRYNGGAQAAHNVITNDGRHHTFAQFGSGTLAGARTFLSRHMLVNPIAMFSEAKHLESLGVQRPMSLVTVDNEAVITTPFHVAMNRLREMARSKSRHGSCGMGIGETARLAETGRPELALRAYDLLDSNTMYEKLEAIRRHLLSEAESLGWHESSDEVEREEHILEGEKIVHDCIEQYRTFTNRVTIQPTSYLNWVIDKHPVIFEGAQGVLLDREFGFFPYVTRSHTTFKHADEMLKDYKGDVCRMGILRAYGTRHGAGPFPTEDDSVKLVDLHNTNGPWQQKFRVGYLDLVLTRYALDVVGKVDEIVLTHMDRIAGPQQLCVAYRSKDEPNTYLKKPNPPKDIPGQEKLTNILGQVVPVYAWTQSLDTFVPMLEEDLGVEVRLLSYGPTAGDKRHRTKIQNVA